MWLKEKEGDAREIYGDAGYAGTRGHVKALAFVLSMGSQCRALNRRVTQSDQWVWCCVEERQ